MKQYSICTCIAAACVIFLALSVNSCKKDDGTVSLKIGAANIGENSKHKQKNYIDIDSLILEVGDPVKVNGVVKQIFEGSEGETCLSVSQSADGYACLYPAHAGTFTCSGISNVGSGVVNIPANQSYTLTNNNKNQKLELPMVDYVVDEHQIVKFRNAASVVKVVVFNLNLNPIIVNSVTISGANLCGDLAFDFDNAQKIITPSTLSNAGNTVTLSCNATVQAGGLST